MPAQAPSYGPDLLPAIRRAAAMIPGDLPVAVNFVSPFTIRAARSYAVETTATDSLDIIYPVFQIRYPRGWIVADAALDHSFFPTQPGFSDAKYDSIQVALRDARLVVLTHEHHDHAAGVVLSPFGEQVQRHTLLTSAQIRTLSERPNSRRIKIDSVVAAHFQRVDYEMMMPLAPGVVLVRAPGHTPGSQLVYVRTAAGTELILAGDVAWVMEGVQRGAQKPESSTRGFGGEDRTAIATELAWLREVQASGVIVTVSHDAAWIAQLVNRGVLHSGFDFRDP